MGETGILFIYENSREVKNLKADFFISLSLEESDDRAVDKGLYDEIVYKKMNSKDSNWSKRHCLLFAHIVGHHSRYFGIRIPIGNHESSTAGLFFLAVDVII